jgi:hypothetical protein
MEREREEVREREGRGEREREGVGKIERGVGGLAGQQPGTYLMFSKVWER